MRYSPKARRYVVCSTSCEAGSSTATGAAPTASTAAAGTDAVDDDLDASTIYRLALCYVHSRKLAHVTIRQLSHGIDVAHEVAREALNRMERDGFLTAPERNLRRGRQPHGRRLRQPTAAAVHSTHSQRPAGRQVVRNAKTLVLFQQAVDFVRSRGLDQRLMEQAMDGMTLAMASGSAASRVKPARAAADAAAKADTARRYGIDTVNACMTACLGARSAELTPSAAAVLHSPAASHSPCGAWPVAARMGVAACLTYASTDGFGARQHVSCSQVSGASLRASLRTVQRSLCCVQAGVWPSRGTGNSP